MLKKLMHNKVAANISWILIGRIIYMILNFVVGLLSARYLGPSNYGLIGYAAAYTTFFSSVCSLGINSIIVKEIIDNPNSEGTIIGTSIVMKIVASFLSLFTIIGLSIILDQNEPLTRIVVLIYNISLILQVFDTFKYWFQSRLQSKYTEIAVTIAYVIMAIYKIILLMSGKNVKWFALANSVECLIVAVVLFILYKKKGGQKLNFSWNDGKRIIKNSYHFIISGVMVALYTSTDKFMLKQMIGENEVAYYSTATVVSSLSSFVILAMIESLTPVIMKAYKKDYNLYKKRNRQLYAVVFYISIFTSIVITIFARDIIKILYSDKYISTIAPLRILTWYSAFSYLGGSRNSWIVCEKKQKYLKYIYFFCVFSNVLLNYLFIPRLGSAGASLASLITQFASVMIFPLLIKELRPNVKLIIDAILLRNVRNN